MKIQSKFEELIQRIRSQITLKRGWYFYFLSLFIFIMVSIFYRDSYWFELGITLFSIAIVYLVMVTSNIEVRETTQKQVKAFVDGLQTVYTELKNVSNSISTLTNGMIEVQRAILESTLASKTAIAKAEEERRKRKESIKPQLMAKVEIRGLHFWFIDNRHYHLLMWNSGSDAKGTIVQVRNLEYGAFNIGTHEQIDIDIGHINEFKGTSKSSVLIEVRDVDRNLYQGNIQVSLPQPQWTSVPLIER